MLANRVFVSADVGNVKRAQKYANTLGGEICIIDKRRKSGKDTVAERIIGDVAGKERSDRRRHDHHRRHNDRGGAHSA